MLTLKKSNDFQDVFKTGKWYSSDIVIMYAKKIDSDINKLGVAVGKKLGKSVVRNRLKRLLREAFRSYEKDLLTGYNIVLVYKNSIKPEELNCEIVKTALLKCLKKADILKEE